MGTWAYFWALYPVPLIYVSVFVPVSYHFDYCIFVVWSEVRQHYSSSSVLKIVLVIQGLLCFHTNFKITCSSSVKNAIGNLIGIALNLYIALGSMVILTILFLPTQEHSISLHLCHFQFLSTVSYKFLSKYLLPP